MVKFTPNIDDTWAGGVTSVTPQWTSVGDHGVQIWARSDETTRRYRRVTEVENIDRNNMKNWHTQHESKIKFQI